MSDPNDPPAFLSPPGVPTAPDRPGTAPGSTPGGLADGAPPRAMPAGSPAGSSGDESLERPLPDLRSLIAAAGGLCAAIGLNVLLFDEDIVTERGTIIAIALVFELVGVGLVVLARSGRTASGGVALSALAAVPLVNAVFTTPEDALDLFGDISGYRNTQMAIQATLAVVWLAGYVFGPGRRYGIYLGAALIALWMIPMTYFTLNAVDDALSGLNDTLSQFEDSGNIDDFDDFDEEPTFGDELPLDPFAFGGFGSGEDPGNTATKLGVTSLLFGGAYLAVGGWLDRGRKARMATPFFAVAPLCLINAIVTLSEELKVVGTSILGLVLGGAAMWLGVQGGRRFTAWIGVASVVGALVALIGDKVDDPINGGMVLTVVGVAAIAGVIYGERSEGGRQPAGPGWEPPPDPWTPVASTPVAADPATPFPASPPTSGFTPVAPAAPEAASDPGTATDRDPWAPPG